MGGFRLREFEWEILKLYIEYGYGYFQLYQINFFYTNLTEENVLLTLYEFAAKAVDYNDVLWSSKDLAEVDILNDPRD